MKPARIFQQYVWIVTMLRQHGALTLEQLDKLWVDDGVGDEEAARLCHDTITR